jgi:hypothetical protein
MFVSGSDVGVFDWLAEWVSRLPRGEEVRFALSGRELIDEDSLAFCTLFVNKYVQKLRIKKRQFAVFCTLHLRKLPGFLFVG